MTFNPAWFDQGVDQGKAFMAIWCDTWDWEDFPEYFDTEAAAQASINEGGGKEMKLMEVYDLRKPKAPQVSQRRCWALRPGNPVPGEDQ